MAQLPERMRCIELTRPGGPEVMVPGERAVPQPGPGEILIRVAAAGVNRPDVVQRSGNYPPPPGASDLLGLEVAGHVAALGEGAARWRLGDAVTALTPGGGYAEYCLTHESHALPIPEGLSLVEAASLPENVFTVWSNVFVRAGLRPGETFLVHGGTSGIGVAAIQMATALGARVIATAGSAAKCDACRKLGAEAVNYREQDFVAEAKRLTSGRGVDVILDMVGGSYVQRNYSAAAEQGRIVQIAMLEGARMELDIRPLMLKRLVHTGSTLRPRSVQEKAAIATDLARHVWPLYAAGRCRPVIHAVLPLAEAAEAHRLMESSAHIGKIMLEVAAR